MYLMLLVLGLHSFLSSHAAELDMSRAFDEANRLYEQSKFGAAADAYEQIIQAGNRTAAVLFNLGNARFRNGELGRAILAFRQAQRLSPRDPDIQANLSVARSKVNGSDAAGPSFASKLLLQWTYQEWWGIAALLGFAFFSILALREWRPQSRGLTFWPMMTLLSLGLIAGACGWAAAQQRTVQIGIITLPEASVRFTPLEESPVYFTAVDGAELRVLGRKADLAGQEGWIEVQDSAGRVGWLRQNQLTLLD